MHNFHKKFNVLLGLPAILKLKINLNFNNNSVTILNKPFKLEYFRSNKTTNFNEQDDTKIRIDHLNNEEKRELLKVIKEFDCIFPKPNEILTHSSTIKHEIKTTDEIPTYTRAYRYPECYKDEINKQINELLKNEIIQESYSPWSSPVWMVPKKLDASGKRKFRMVIDYRKLNAKTIDDKFPIPNITDVLDKLGKNIYYTTLDLASGFHQIEMHENSIQKTAFNTDKGHFEFRRMPFGLKNAPATFQRLMNFVLRDYINKICLVYLDDIIILGTSLQEHIQNIRKIFSKLKEHNLKLQLDKSEFLQKEVAYLGHVVSSEGVKPNPAKIQAVQDFPIPKTPKEIKTYLGLLGYYRKFIPNFSKLTKPLTQCLKKGNKIDTTDKTYRDSFEHSKTLLINAPILQYPDFTKQFILTTDASNYALGAVLSQKVNGKDLPIAYASRTLNDHEINYSTTEKELLSIVWSTKYFRPYLYGNKFKICTDHRPLVWLMSLKDPNSKLMRWKIKLDEFNFEIEYKKGALNSNADALSRIKPKFQIVHTTEDIFEKPCNIAYLYSKDTNFTEQLDAKFDTKTYLSKTLKITDKILAQPINSKYTLFHLIIKPDINIMKQRFEDLKEYCVNNEIYNIHIPHIYNDTNEINPEILKDIINETFKETHIKIILHETPSEIFVNENESVIAQMDDEELDTNHSADENELNGLTYKETCVNIGNQQILMNIHDKETTVNILNLFNNQKQRLIVKFNKQNLKHDIFEFIKEYLVPKVNYHCLIENDLILLINEVLQNNFLNKSYNLIQCENLLTDVDKIDEQISIITNYHLGKTNHRGISETYMKLKRQYYWPKMQLDITKYINNCETCQTNKYERNPFQLNNNLTKTAKFPFDIVHIDTITLKNEKYLTIVDSFSKFAQIYKIKTVNALDIVDKLLEYFSFYQIPNEIIHDSGTEFNNNLVKELLKIYKIKIHMTCVDNPKSNGLIERFHSTLIEHLRIINQSKEFQNVNLNNKLKFAIIAYNNTLNTVTKFTPLEIMFGADKDKTIFETKFTIDDYLVNYKNKLKILHNEIRQNLQKEKTKRFAQQKPETKPLQLPEKVFIKEGKRRIQKFKKPLFKIHKIEGYDPKLGTIRTSKNKRHKIDKIKKPRLYHVADVPTVSETKT